MLEPPTSGEIWVDGENIMAKGYRLDKMRKKMGMVFQSFNLFDHMTVLENITYAPVRLLKLSEEKAREEAMVYDGALRFEHLNPPKGGNAITIRTRGEGEGSLYCWRDSFGIALYPYLADAFQEACFSRSTEYTLPEGRYDAVILELVERNLPQLLPDPAA